MKALGDKVLVKPEPQSDTTESGITLVEGGKKPLMKGTVISVGSEVKAVKNGDHILFSPFHYDEVDKNNIVMLEDDIWAKLE